MAPHRYFIPIAAVAFCLSLAQAQSTSAVALDDNYLDLVETDNRVLGLDYQSQVFFSTDDGQSFAPLSTLSTDPIDSYYAMAAIGSTVVSVGTDGLIARSVNEGSNWTASVNTDFISGDLRTVAGRSDTTNVWISAGGDGIEGVILRSADDGLNWSESTSIDDLGFSGSVWTGASWLVCGLDELSFEGVVYRSTDNGLTWGPVTLPASVAPLLSFASDGAGNVVAVGESGMILYSADHGQTFVQLGAGLLSEDLLVAVATGTNEFFVGGGGKVLLQLQGASITILREPVGGAPEVEALLFVGDNVLAGGAFSSNAVRTLPLVLNIADINGSVRLSIDEGLSGRTYTLETSVNLEDWEIVSNAALVGSNGPLEWNLLRNGTRRFWRVEEF